MKKLLLTLSLVLSCLSMQAQFLYKQPEISLIKNISIALTGDIMMGTTFPTVQIPSDDGKYLFTDVKDILTDATLALGNLEGTLCDGGSTKKKVGKACYAFRTPTSFSPRLSEAGYDFLSLANNHANDFGEKGLSSTIECLENEGIAYAGIEGLCETAFIEKDGIKYGICAFGHNSYTLRHTDKSTVDRILQEVDGMCDIMIVSFHGGAEGRSHSHLPYGKEVFYGENRGSLRDFAHYCIDNGADIIYGHGPHVVRAMELYKDRFVIYSLGNFCTPYSVSLSGVSGYSPIITINVTPNGEFVDGQIHSFIQTRGVGPREDSTNAVVKQLQSLTKSDFPGGNLEIADDGSITKI